MISEFLVVIVLVSSNCASEENMTEFVGLTEIAFRYLASFGFVPTIEGYCIEPNMDISQFEHGDASIVMFDYELWSDWSYELFGYEPPEKGTKSVQGTVFFYDKRVLTSFSLADDLNSPIMTHELMHFVLWEKGFPEDVFIDQVHEDWYEYQKVYQTKEKLYSTFAQKYYYIFG